MRRAPGAAVVAVVELDEDDLVRDHVREIIPAMRGIVVEDGRGDHVLLARDLAPEIVALGQYVDVDLGVARALLVADAGAVAKRQRPALRRRGDRAPEAEGDEAVIAGPVRRGRRVERGGEIVGRLRREIDMRLRRRRLYAGAGLAGGADHAAHRHDEIGAGQFAGPRDHLGRVDGVDMVRVAPVGHRGPVGGEAEAVPVERERLGREPGVADGDRIGLIDAGVELRARRPEAAVDPRGRDQIVDLRVDRLGRAADRPVDQVHVSLLLSPYSLRGRGCCRARSARR